MTGLRCGSFLVAKFALLLITIQEVVCMPQATLKDSRAHLGAQHAVGRVNGPSKLEELSDSDLLEADPEDEEGDSMDLGPGDSCKKTSQENLELLKRISKLERIAAEQDTSLGQLRRAVRELRDVRDKQDVQPESCQNTVPVRCEVCP